MRARLIQFLCGTVVLGMVASATRGEDQPQRPQRGQPIVFSEVKSETISTNYNPAGSKSSFKELDNELKTPFEFFSRDTKTRPLRPPATQPMIQRTKKSQELFGGKEDSFFGKSEDDELLNNDPAQFDPWTRKMKTPLDRYYDRLDRERIVVTNRSKGDNFMGMKREEDERSEFGASGDFFGRFFRDNSSGSARFEGASQSANRVTNGFTGGLFSTDPVRPQTLDNLLGIERNLVAEDKRDAVDTRRDAFRELLGMSPVSKVQDSTFDNTYSVTKPTEPYTSRSSYGLQPSSSPKAPRSSLSGFPGYSTTPKQNTTAQGFVPIPGLTPPLETQPQNQKPKLNLPPASFTPRGRDF